jgi:hypothetical protein
LTVKKYSLQQEMDAIQLKEEEQPWAMMEKKLERA